MTRKGWIIIGVAGIVTVAALANLWNDLPQTTAAVPAKVRAASHSDPSFEKIGGNPAVGSIYAMIGDARMPAQAWEAAARARCRDETFCDVHGWTEKANAASTLPMTDTQVEAEVYSYNLNRKSGNDRSLWRCGRFAGIGSDRCFSGSGE
jgi:hypothetical protein